MRLGSCLEVAFEQNDDVQGLAKLLMQHFCLVDVCFDAFFNRYLLEILGWDMAVVNFSAIVAGSSPSSIDTCRAEVERSIGAQFGNQMQPTLAYHLTSRMIAKVTIKRHIAQWNQPCDLVQLLVQHLLDALQFRRQLDRQLVLVPAAFGSSRFAL